MDEDFKQAVKTSFRKAKEHTDALEAQINHLNGIIEKQQELLSLLQEAIFSQKKESSTGNEGVSLNIHSLVKHSLNTNYALKTPFKEVNIDLNSLKSIENTLLKLTKQEFLTFLTIYQLEEDLKRVITYADIATRLNLSEGCIRTYIYQIQKKGIPLIKNKVNNRLITLTIKPEFRSLSLKSKLLELYNQTDPHQSTLEF